MISISPARNVAAAVIRRGNGWLILVELENGCYRIYLCKYITNYNVTFIIQCSKGYDVDACFDCLCIWCRWQRRKEM